jgi:hypothetical protein
MTIARDWNERGLPGATGCPWTAKTLRKVLLSARIAGLRCWRASRSLAMAEFLTATFGWTLQTKRVTGESRCLSNDRDPFY